MKKLLIVFAITGFLAVSIAVISVVFYFSNQYLNGGSEAKQPTIAKCQNKGAAHVVLIQNNNASPKHTQGSLCDTLTITNNDDRIRLMAFGEHENHQPYDGVTEQQLAKGQSLTITLNQTGTYVFHDHIGDVVQGDFTVTK